MTTTAPFTGNPADVYSTLTGSELRAEELVLSWLYAPDHVGIAFGDWVMSSSIQHTSKNGVEDRFIMWSDIGRVVDRLRPAKRRFLIDYYRRHLPWLLICRRCHIRPETWMEYRKNLLHLLARWLML
jgi:hypothetical protein